MATFVEAMTGFMKANFCAALDVLGDAVTLGSELVPGPGPFINVANGLGALVCDRPPDNLAAPEPPFTGGQCPGVNYRITWNWSAPGFNSGPQTADRTGPLGFSRAGTGSLDCGSSGLTYNVYTLTEGTGVNPVSLAAGCGAEVNDLTVTRLDGQPDNCGDPPAPLPEPGDTYNFGGDITYEGDDNTNITVPVTAVFAPIFVDVDGSLRIPVNVDVGGVEFTGNLEVSPSFTLNLRPKGITSGPGKPDDPELGPGQPGVPVPEDEEDVEVIVGVLVFSTLVGNNNDATGFPSVGGPTFLVPRLGSVQFAIKTGNSIGWTSDLDVKNLECYVPCPAPQGAIAVRVTPIAGVTRTFTPVRGKPLTSF